MNIAAIAAGGHYPVAYSYAFKVFLYPGNPYNALFVTASAYASKEPKRGERAFPVGLPGSVGMLESATA